MGLNPSTRQALRQIHDKPKPQTGAEQRMVQLEQIFLTSAEAPELRGQGSCRDVRACVCADCPGTAAQSAKVCGDKPKSQLLVADIMADVKGPAEVHGDVAGA